MPVKYNSRITSDSPILSPAPDGSGKAVAKGGEPGLGCTMFATLTTARDRLEEGDAAGALALLTPLLRFDLGMALPFWMAASALTRLGRWPEALERYGEAQARDPGLTVMEFQARGLSFLLADAPGSGTGRTVLGELYDDAYGLDGLNPQPGEVFVDVGAHIGGVAIALAKRHPDTPVIAYEANPATFALLQANLQRNRVTNVQAVNCAVAGAAGTLTLIEPIGDTGAATAMVAAAEHRRLLELGCRAFSVPAITLDDLFARHAIARSRLLKLDCEGAEHDIIANAQVFDRVSALAMELHLLPDQAEEGARAITDRLLAPLLVHGVDVRIASTVLMAVR